LTPSRYRPVADAEQTANGQGAAVEHEGEGDGAALANQGDAALDLRTYDLVRQHGGSVEEVDEAVTVGSKEGQIARLGNEVLGEAMTQLAARFGKAGGEADEAAAAACRQGARHGRGFLIRDGNKGRIRCLG